MKTQRTEDIEPWRVVWDGSDPIGLASLGGAGVDLFNLYLPGETWPR